MPLPAPTRMHEPPTEPDARRRYEDLVARATPIARRFVSEAQADEVAHDVAVDLLPRSEVSGPLLYIAVTWRLRVVWRNSARRAANEREYFELRAGATPAWAQPDAGLEVGELRERIRHTLAQMPAGMREAFMLVRDDELSYKEAAERLGVGVGTVHTHVSRANALLRDCVKQYHADRPLPSGVGSRTQPQR
jgi:RNA polymerase sigma factor (sigma-70 family)